MLTVFVWTETVAVEGKEVTRQSVWTETVEVTVVGSVCVAKLTWDARADSQRSRSSRIPASLNS